MTYGILAGSGEGLVSLQEDPATENPYRRSDLLPSFLFDLLTLSQLAGADGRVGRGSRTLWVDWDVERKFLP